MHYVALSDLSSYDSQAYYIVLRPNGQKQLEETNDIGSVLADDVELSIPITDLIAAYNQLHGTTY